MNSEKSKEKCEHDFEHIIENFVSYYRCLKCFLKIECWACKQEVRSHHMTDF
jgi:hypothetical protein